MDLSWARMNPFQKSEALRDNPQPPRRQDGNPKPPKSEVIPPKENEGGEGDDPMLNFESLWEPNRDKDGKEIVDNNNDNGPYMPQLDGKKLGDMVEKMDFTNGTFDDQDLADMKEGGDKAIAANFRVMQKMSRKIFSSALSASSRLTEGGFANARKRFDGQMPERFRDLMTENELSSGSGLMANPAFQPMVKSLKAQYLKKFPKATPSEINGAINQYFEYMIAEAGKAKSKGKQDTDITDNQTKLRKGAADADFMDWISSEVDGSRASPFADDENPDA